MRPASRVAAVGSSVTYLSVRSFVAFGVRETLLIVTVAQLLGLLWLIGSPITRLREIPEPPE